MRNSRFDKEFFIRNLFIYEKDIFRFLCSITGNPETAQDLLQNTMEKAWRNLDQLKEIEKSKKWIFSIAYREAMQYYRRRNQNVVYEDTAESRNHTQELYEVRDEIADFIINRDECQVIKKALCRLEVKYQRLIRMRYLEDLPMKEIAELLDLNYSTVRVYMGRALVRLKEIYSEIERGKTHNEGDPISRRLDGDG